MDFSNDTLSQEMVNEVRRWVRLLGATDDTKYREGIKKMNKEFIKLFSLWVDRSKYVSTDGKIRCECDRPLHPIWYKNWNSYINDRGRIVYFDDDVIVGLHI